MWSAEDPRMDEEHVAEEVSDKLFKIWNDLDPFTFGGQNRLECLDCSFIERRTDEGYYSGYWDGKSFNGRGMLIANNGDEGV